ncbi:ESF1 homolog [Amyelois transitella]|uniref:ESF1 homolog n=1 Tax=Amyelois transitella TaxID=680683 RepID=UPI00067CED85|nr:ESF1 homolog [Amyelois transitella]
MGDILKDSRFAKYLNDPRYKPIPKHKRKVKIDKRFQSMFSGDNFKVKYAVDKRGRPVNETSVENLRKYYDLEESDNTDDETEETEKVQKINDESVETFGRFVRRPPSEEPEDEKPHPSTENDKLVRGKLDYKIKQRLQNLDIDYARGQGVLVSGSSSSEEDSTDNEEDGELEHEWGELDADAGTTEDSTKRIAICNMDWDNIKAVDLMVLLNSFIPPGGIIHKISIYPSEYGLKRMQEEEVRGPIELTEKPDEIEQSGDEGHEEGSIYHMEKLRRYQLNRLKYFYAVVECDSVATADKLYSECDGMEYESSATKLDMRFIPDDIKFDQVPREVCTKLPDLTKYKPRLFTTTALQHAKVELTWDATNPNRTQAIRSALDGKIDDLDLKDYLASSSEDENPDDEDSATILDKDSEDPIHKYKSLLEEIESKEENKKNKDMELEITWGLGIKDRAEELVKKKLNEEAKDLTPFEKLMKKRKEKKKERKLKIKQEEEHENKLDVGNSSSDEVPSDIDLNDPYFAEEFNKPEFKKAKKLSKKSNESEDGVEEEKRKAELKLLLDDEDDNKAHFSLKKIQEAESSTKKSKRKKILNEKMKKQKQEQKQALPDFEINLNDNRFSAIYNSHLYNIDPTNPNFKKTKNMEKLIEEKLRRRPVDTPVEEVHVQSKKSKQDAELSLLVKNIKRKTKHDVKK